MLRGRGHGIASAHIESARRMVGGLLVECGEVMSNTGVACMISFGKMASVSEGEVVVLSQS